MGLAGPRNRRKLQHDPNNTKWSRDETTFGQRILRAQGWEPGKFLGAQNASHSHLHSAASAAPINVVLKDDTMGLGAKTKHKQNAECTGLDVFKDLLGRLNGKSEETIAMENQVRSGFKTNLYVEKKYGLMRFVSGGLLVGDQMNESIITATKTEPLEQVEGKESITTSEDTAFRSTNKQKKSKKRKAEDSDSADGLNAASEKKRKKRSKDEGSQNDSAGSLEANESSSKKSKKSKRKEIGEDDLARSEKKKKSKKSKKDPKIEAEGDDTPVVPSNDRVEKPKSKKEKKDKHKKNKKEKKQKLSDPADSSTYTPNPQESENSTPTGTGTSTPQVFSARHLARSRNIASKRLAMADMQALNQIFMVKPV